MVHMAAGCTRNTPTFSPIQAGLAHRVTAGCIRTRPVPRRSGQGRQRAPFRGDQSVLPSALLAFSRKSSPLPPCLHALQREGCTRLPSQRTIHCHLKDGGICVAQRPAPPPLQDASPVRSLTREDLPQSPQHQGTPNGTPHPTRRWEIRLRYLRPYRQRQPSLSCFERRIASTTS